VIYFLKLNYIAGVSESKVFRYRNLPRMAKGAGLKKLSYENFVR